MNQGREEKRWTLHSKFGSMCVYTSVFLISILIDLTRKRFSKNATQILRAALQPRHH